MDRTAPNPDAPTEEDLIGEAVALARDLLERSRHLERRGERRRQARLARLIQDPAGRELVFELTDQVLRIDDDRRAAERFTDIVATHRDAPIRGIDRALLGVGARAATVVPAVVMPLVRRRVAAETRGIVLAAENRPLGRHLARRRAEGVRLIVNPLGEAILSDREADARVDRVLAHIARPDVDYVSIKISALVANLDVLAFDRSVERIVERLRRIFRAAQRAVPRTFVNLDMEEFGDLDLSLAAFMTVLDDPEFAAIDAGVVLQAYLPDSHDALDRVGTWAARRRGRGRGRIKVRLVKGANLAMEAVEAELHNWQAAPYPTKSDVDASYKAMLERALAPDWADSMRVGVATHNLFDVAWALVVARTAGALDRVDFEMLEGMAPGQARAVQERVGTLLMYGPVVDRHDFDASIAYLARRLDENTQPENFLRGLFDLRPDTPAWDEQVERFRLAVRQRGNVSTAHRRGPLVGGVAFANEPDTDFTGPAARRGVADAAKGPAVRAPEPITSAREIHAVLERAAAAYDRWTNLAPAERRRAIHRAAEELRRGRLDAIAVMGRETGKTVREADPEVSEAIDFATYYAGPGIDLLDELRRGDDAIGVGGRGVVAVIGPWNFPYAIPAGGVFAALAAGNAVVLKPAPEAERVATLLVDQLHRSGLDPHLVQLVVCEDGPIGRQLVTHRLVDTVVLTGGFDTARMFLDWKPDLRLFAETSGKNALVITATADLDLALDDLVNSAFGHAGQKCSAASVGIIEASLYDDPQFHGRLRDVVSSRVVGWPDDPSAVIGPVITPPSGTLLRALTVLDGGERWLLEPMPVDDSGRLWRPGVRVDVRPGSWFHRTECFGPVLGLMRADDLDHAITIQNDSEFGLTGGLHSLDPAEIEHWCERVEVGNAYVNRAITGAVVRRQPFGGWKHSSVGPGTKAGGPNYLLQFSRLLDPPDADARVERSYSAAWREQFTVEHDPSGLRSESNVLRYRPVRRMVVRHDGSDRVAIDRLRTASRVTAVELIESDRRTESEEAFLASLDAGDRVRTLAPTMSERRALAARAMWFDTDRPSSHGRVELLNWVREQSVSRTVHRHGRVRRPPDRVRR